MRRLLPSPASPLDALLVLGLCPLRCVERNKISLRISRSVAFRTWTVNKADVKSVHEPQARLPPVARRQTRRRREPAVPDGRAAPTGRGAHVLRLSRHDRRRRPAAGGPRLRPGASPLPALRLAPSRPLG